MTLIIYIGRRPGLAEQVWTVLSVPVLILTIPAANHLMLGGHWSLDALGGMVGLVVAASIRTAMRGRVRTFRTARSAARWVAGWGDGA